MQNDIYQFLRKLRSAFQNFYLDEIISIIRKHQLFIINNFYD